MFKMDFCMTPECAAPIIWTTDEHDSFLAVDYDPSPDGTWFVVPRKSGKVPLAKKAVEGTELRTTHRSHDED